MNDERRKRIEHANAIIDGQKSLLIALQTEEQNAFDSMPDGLQEGESGQKSEAAAEALQDALDSCSDVLRFLKKATEE